MQKPSGAGRCLHPPRAESLAGRAAHRAVHTGHQASVPEAAARAPGLMEGRAGRRAGNAACRVRKPGPCAGPPAPALSVCSFRHRLPSPKALPPLLPLPPALYPVLAGPE